MDRSYCKFFLAIFFMLSGPALIWATNLAVKYWIDYQHSLQEIPTVPNQGAMVIGFLVFLASIPIGAGILGFGLTLLIRNLIKGKANSQREIKEQ